MHDDARAPFPLTRPGVQAARREDLHRGSWTKADLYLIHTERGPVVVKDFAGKSFLIRIAGRLQISRECATYQALEGVEGVARWLGRIDAHALAMERLEGEPLRKFRKRTGREELLEKLRRVLDAIHERGIIHNDLRGKDNTLVRADGRVVLIDFAGALRFRRGGLWHRVLFDRLTYVDEAAYLKWKTILAPGSLTRQEEKFLRRFAFFRRFWLFNPKGALRQS